MFLVFESCRLVSMDEVDALVRFTRVVCDSALLEVELVVFDSLVEGAFVLFDMLAETNVDEFDWLSFCLLTVVFSWSTAIEFTFTLAADSED